MPSTNPRSRRDAAIASSLAIAVSLLAGGMIAHAQSFQASGVSVPAGSATVLASPGTTEVQVYSRNVVLDWTPSDTAGGTAPIIFQPAGTTATFIGFGAVNGDFTVLNRIIPTVATRPIEFDGHVISQIFGGSGPSVTGGTVYFYSPGGIIVGNGAVFDVGNLGLTTSDIAYDTNSSSSTWGDFRSATGVVTFSQASNPAAVVKVAKGATINALNAGSYVAMVAPKVANSGTINVNGSAALVAAEGATIRFSPDGLFDIQVDTGSDGGSQALSNDGTITGPAGNGLTQSHRIYMVAVPKNTAIGIAIAAGSKLGFDVAASADTDGNAVILSAGGDVSGGNATGFSNAGSSVPASISVDDGGGTIDFTSTVHAIASGNFALASSGTTTFATDLDASGAFSSTVDVNGGTLSVGRDTYLRTFFGSVPTTGANDGGTASMVARGGGTISLGGNVTVSAAGEGDFNLDAAISGGAASLAAQGANSKITIGGSALVDASASDLERLGLPVTGGTATISATAGGSLSVAGGAQVLAGALSQANLTSRGGIAQAIIGNGGAMNVGSLTLNADAMSGSPQFFSPSDSPGGDSTGGTAQVLVQGTASSFTSTGLVTLGASATGGTGSCSSCLVDGGAATGGTTLFTTSAAAHTVNVGGISMAANAAGGLGDLGAGGLATGGTATLLAGAGSTIASTGAISLSTSGNGGFSSQSAGGAAIGGASLVEADNGATISVPGSILVNADAIGGTAFSPTGPGGDATGGLARVYSHGGSITLSADANGSASVSVSAVGRGGGGLGGGNAQGGTAAIDADAGGAFGVNSGASFANVSLFADAYAGRSTYSGGRSGNATGGTSRVQASGGATVTINAALSQYADAHKSVDPNDGTGGGNGTGGTVLLAQDTGGAVSVTGNILLEAFGEGGDDTGFGTFTGGIGKGGTVTVSAGGGAAMQLGGGSLRLVADGFGGGGLGLSADSNGGAGIGGDVQLVSMGSDLIVNAVTSLSAQGVGGDSRSSGNGGSGTGGTAIVGTLANAGSGSLTLAAGEGLDAVMIGVQAIGGNGAGIGAGGAATGGAGRFVAAGGNTSVVGNLRIDASARAGNSYAAGGAAATGGTAALDTGNSFNTSIGGNLTLNADATGGANLADDGTGGQATGGTARLSQANGGQTIISGSALVSASASGGMGQGASASGGNAQGGQAFVNAGGGLLSIAADLTVGATATGGDGDGGSALTTGGIARGGQVNVGADAGIAANTGAFSGQLSVGGATNIGTDATGGNAGIGGSATGGNTRLYAAGGTINLTGATNFYANATGGFSQRGNGSAATGGSVLIQADGSPIGPTLINVGDAQLLASANAGSGGQGVGGTATGGNAAVLVGAGDATLTAGNVVADVSAAGGAGGIDPVTGNGAFGGTAINGSVLIGSTASAWNGTATGGATFASITAVANAIGGLGGAGAIGGTGGDAHASSPGARLSVLGLPVTVTGSVQLSANAIGGTGGTGSVSTGNGGAAIVGEGGGGAYVVVSDPTSSGSPLVKLTVGSLVGTSTATGGLGATNGTGFLAGPAIGLTMDNASASIGSIALSSAATTVLTTAQPSVLYLANAQLQVPGDFSFVTPGAIIVDLSSATLTVRGTATISAADWLLPTSAPATAGTINAATALFTTGNNLLSYANLVLGSSTTLSAPGSVRFGNVSGGSDLNVVAQAGSIALGNLAVGRLDARAKTTLRLGNGTSAGNVTLQSGGALTTGAFTATGTFGATSGAAATLGNISALQVSLSAANGLSTGAVTSSQQATLQSGGAMSVASLSAGGAVSITSGGSATIGNVNGSLVGVTAAGNLTLGTVNSGGNATLQSGGALNTGAITATGTIGAISSGSAVLGNLNGNQVGVTATGNLTLGTINSGGDAVLQSGGAVGTGAITALGTIGVISAGSATLGNLKGDQVGVNATTGLLTGAIAANSTVNLQSGGSITTGDVTTNGSFAAVGGGAVSVGNASGMQVGLIAGTGVSAGNIAAQGNVVLQSGTGMSVANIASGAYVQVQGGGAVTLGNVDAGAAVSVTSGSNLSVGNVTSGIVNPLTTQGTVYGVQLVSGSNVSAGGLNTVGDILVAAPGDMTVGSANGRDLQLLSGTSAKLGALTAKGRILVGNYHMLTYGQGANGYNFEPAFAAKLEVIEGPITISGAVSAGRFFHAATSGSLAAQAITAGSDINVDSSGLVSVNGLWAAPSITIASSDIAIAPSSPAGSGGGLNAGVTGSITLLSNNTAGAFIGDGLTAGDGYALSNAEWQTIRSGSLFVGVTDGSGPVDLTIGDLTITGPASGSTIDDPNGSVTFATGTSLTQAASGGILVKGKLVGTGFNATNRLIFDTGTFELDAGTGSIKVDNGHNALGGIVEISADHIHIAEASILEKLRADPFYAGRFDDLNAPAATQRTDGVFNALGFDLYPGSTLYIQNMGTAQVPAGFFTTLDASDITPPDVPPTGGVSVIINGAFQTATGLVTGAAAYNLLVNSPTADFTGFATDSTLNGCALSAKSCGTQGEPGVTGIADEISVLTGDPLPDLPPGLFDDSDNGRSDDSSGHHQDEGTPVNPAVLPPPPPIVPPQPLINTNPLNPALDVTEPITGSGNPSLFGTGAGAGTGQGDNQGGAQ